MLVEAIYVDIFVLLKLALEMIRCGLCLILLVVIDSFALSSRKGCSGILLPYGESSSSINFVPIGSQLLCGVITLLMGLRGFFAVFMLLRTISVVVLSSLKSLIFFLLAFLLYLWVILIILLALMSKEAEWFCYGYGD